MYAVFTGLVTRSFTQVLLSIFKACRGPRAYLRSLTPSSFCKRGLLQAPPRPGGDAAAEGAPTGIALKHLMTFGCLHMISSLTIMGTVMFLLLAVRFAPFAWKHLQAGDIEERLRSSLPAGVELRVENGTLWWEPAEARGDDIRASLPPFLFDSDASFRHHESIYPGFQPVEWLIRTSVHAITSGPSPRIFEFTAGEAVEVRVQQDLLACGFPRSPWPIPLGGAWAPAVVLEVLASHVFGDFRYLVRMGGPEEGLPEDGGGRACEVQAIHVRRPRHHALFVAPGRRLGLADLEETRATFVFEETRFAALEGYSLHHRQHWQYAVSDLATGEAQRGYRRLWHGYTEEDMRGNAPLSILMDTACVVSDTAGWSLRCSAEIAHEHFMAAAARLPGFPFVMTKNLHLCVVYMLLWLSCVVCTNLMWGALILVVLTPTAYFACCLVRHVDTPIAPIRRICIVVMYTSIPAVYGSSFCASVWDAWGSEGHFPPALAAVVERGVGAERKLLVLWALWNSYLVSRMREHASRQERMRWMRRGLRDASPAGAHPAAAEGEGKSAAAGEKKDAATATEAPGTESSDSSSSTAAQEGSAAGPSSSSGDGDAPGNAASSGDGDVFAPAASSGDGNGPEPSASSGDREAPGPSAAPGDGHTPRAASGEAGPEGPEGPTAGGTDVSSTAAQENGPGPSASPDPGGLDDAESESGAALPTCRICFGGDEAGPLISPCLCTGTVRYVHADCLNAWRAASSNPHSFYHCDQCRYRYCFGRTAYANVLRSALVLYAVACGFFVAAVLACGHALVFVDMSVRTLGLDGIGIVLFPDSWGDDVVEQIANMTDFHTDFIREQLAASVAITFGGLNFPHIVSGLCVVGFAGFVSMGLISWRFFWFPVPGGVAWPIMIVVGAFRALFAIFGVIKTRTGRWLQAADSQLLEVEIHEEPSRAPADEQLETGRAGFF